MKAKTRRVYRLRTFLAHTEACEKWQRFVCGFETADEVLAAINKAPGKPVARDAARISRAWSLRYHAGQVACILGDPEAAEWWDERAYRNGSRNGRITPEEAERFRALWVRYADAHGLYEEVPA